MAATSPSSVGSRDRYPPAQKARQKLAGLLLVFLLFGSFALHAQDGLQSVPDAKRGSGEWPQWRGADRANASSETGLLSAWPPDGPTRLWSVSGLGDNIHSVAVFQGSVYAVANRDGSEWVVAFDERSGTQKWLARIGPAIEENKLMRLLSQRAPTINGAYLFWFSVRGDLVCLNTVDGTEIWRKQYLAEFGAGPSLWGYCDFPFVDGPALICTPLGTNAAVVALDKSTGALRWKTAFRPEARCSYAPTVVSDANSIRQYVVSSTVGLFGIQATDGKLLWQFPRPTRISASTYTPAILDHRVCSPNGYGNGVVGIEITASGGEMVAREQYRFQLALNSFQDCAARVGDRLYLVQSNLVCLDLKTGHVIWGEAGVRPSEHMAMTYADGHIYLQRASGTMEWLQILPQGLILKGSFPIPEHKRALGVTSPVVAAGRLYIRDGDHLHCYAVSPRRPSELRPAPKTVMALPSATDGLTQSPGETAPRRMGVNRAPDAVFLPTPQEIVLEMLKAAQVRSTDRVVDLGSGDGRFVVTAAKVYGAHATGYVIDLRLVEQSRQTIAQEGLESLARIEHADLFTLDLKDADVITVFLYPRLMERLVPQFEKLKPGSRIVSHQFEIPGIKPDREWSVPCSEDGENHRLLMWTTPLRRQ